MKIICSFCKQEKEHYAKGFCRSCYKRYKRRGTPEYYVRQSDEERLVKHRESCKKYRKQNPEKVAALNLKWEKNNIEKRKKYKKQWYLKNRERILEKIHNNNFKSEVE